LIPEPRRPRWPRRPLSRTDRSALWTVLLVIPVIMLAAIAKVGFDAYRFEHHAVTVDALIISSDTGCIGAFGGGGGSGVGGKTSITYLVEFPYQGQPFRTDVVRPCRVVPPDFGRGRGSIWVQYDQDHPQRIRVLNDNEAAVITRLIAIVLSAYLLIVGVGSVVIRRTRPR